MLSCRSMAHDSKEIEIKLRFDSADRARHRIEELGATRVTQRRFESNVLFDREHQPLKPARRMLRVRRVGAESLLTYKGPVSGETQRHKVRVEHETAVADPDALVRLLEGLGFFPAYRYEKYRTLYDLGGLQICLDETPLGCFVELEGDPSAIDAAARRMGFSTADYVVESYRELHLAATPSGVPAAALVFEQEGLTTT